jgi:hypothetical protein
MLARGIRAKFADRQPKLATAPVAAGCERIVWSSKWPPEECSAAITTHDYNTPQKFPLELESAYRT